MYLGKVIGTVVSTIKTPSLTGSKFLIVEKINQDLTAKKQTEIAVDTVGAGDGETVIVVGGSSARMSNGKKTDLPVDAAITFLSNFTLLGVSTFLTGWLTDCTAGSIFVETILSFFGAGLLLSSAGRDTFAEKTSFTLLHRL